MRLRAKIERATTQVCSATIGVHLAMLCPGCACLRLTRPGSDSASSRQAPPRAPRHQPGVNKGGPTRVWRSGVALRGLRGLRPGMSATRAPLSRAPLHGGGARTGPGQQDGERRDRARAAHGALPPWPLEPPGDAAGTSLHG